MPPLDDKTSETLLERRLARVFFEARSMVEHEDNLIDLRTKWILTTSTFLFAFYGALLIAEVQFLKDDTTAANTFLFLTRIALCLLGIVIARRGAESIEAAHLAIRAIMRKYNDFLIANERGIEAEKLHVWKLIGDKGTHVPGAHSAITQPFMLAWLWTLLMFGDFWWSLRHMFDEPVNAATEFLLVILPFFLAAASAAYFRCKIREMRKTIETSGRISGEKEEAKAKNKVLPHHTRISNESFLRPLPFHPINQQLEPEE